MARRMGIVLKGTGKGRGFAKGGGGGGSVQYRAYEYRRDWDDQQRFLKDGAFGRVFSIQHDYYREEEEEAEEEQQQQTRRERTTVKVIPMVHEGNGSFYESVAQEIQNFSWDRHLVLAEGETWQPPTPGVDRFLDLSGHSVHERGCQGRGLFNSRFVRGADSCPEEFSGMTYVEFLIACVKAMLEDLTAEKIQRRDRTLKRALEEALQERKWETIVVPWGGAHAPAVEEFLLEKGFRLQRTHPRCALNSFSTGSLTFFLSKLLPPAFFAAKT